MPPTENPPVLLTLRPLRTTLVLLGILVFLTVGYGSTQLIRHFFNPETDFGLIRFFDFGQEANLPTYFSALNLLFASLLLGFIAAKEKASRSKSYLPWTVLAVSFLFLSTDEAARIHEGILGHVGAYLFDDIWPWGHQWLLICVPLVAIGVPFFIPFLRQLPRKYRIGFIASGSLFICGSVGFELVHLAISVLEMGAGWILLSRLFEEGLEMLAIICFNYFLLDYLSQGAAAFVLKVNSDTGG